ncbi:3820_t:CDS:2 [Diversispora eburnea]|uniref:3820_t:CDS:1 n=1 Tax=Diversispora eburnea TaxID=1213867 RepID=A0A9N9B232_9GLOM|nr:3820_t:CDS:2 [Diversispora eburnea]
MENDAFLEDNNIPKFIDNFLDIPKNDPNSFENFLASGGEHVNFPPNDITLTPMGKTMRNKAIDLALQDLSTSSARMINDLTPIRIEKREKGFLSVDMFQIVIWTAFIFSSVEFGTFVPYFARSVKIKTNTTTVAALAILAKRFEGKDEIEIDQTILNKNVDNFINPINQCGQDVGDCEENSSHFASTVYCEPYKGCQCSCVVNSPISGCQNNCVIAGRQANNGGGYSWNELQY